ncbi:MAG TPA: hypothetical protein VLJ19_22360 [Variovorax sp.]|nr:hypothetical protein [Variovorax sp.]
MNTLSDRAVLERALIAIEQVMGKRDVPLGWGVPVGTPAHQAASLCLTAAAALVDVSQALLREPADSSLEALTTEWQGVIAHTKNAGRTAHQVVLLLSAQNHLVAAQGGIIVSGNGQL